jgi:hypothetical protein
MTLTNNEVSFILKEIEEIKKIKGLPFLDFVFKIIDIKKIIKTKVDGLQEKAEVITKERQELLLKYCLKKDGKPIIENNSYQGLFRGINEEYDQRTDELNKEITTLGNQPCEFTEDETKRIESVKIDKKIFENSQAKAEFTGDMVEAILYFIIKE